LFQYGKAQQQYLPVDGYEWMPPEVFDSIDWERVDDEGPRGCILEVDLDYPDHLHELHSDFPLAPENTTVTASDLSAESLKTLQSLRGNINIGDAKHTATKLIGSFRERKNYVVHFSTLKTYLRLGMKLKKIHRILAFNQSNFMAPYIEYIAKLRAETNSKWENKTYKLLANAVYGKLCENSRNYINVRFCQTLPGVQRAMTSPFFESFRIYGLNLVAIFSKPKKVEMKHCLSVGFSILEHSKRIMQELYFDKILPLSGLTPGRGIRLCASDTDSFILSIKCNHINDFFQSIEPCMDFSNYDDTHPLYDDSKKGVVGLFKDETEGKNAITGVACLRSKCYSLKMDSRYVDCKLCEKTKNPECICFKKNTCKGCPKSTTKLLSFDDYEKAIFSHQPHRETFCKIVSKDHRVFTNKQTRLIFASFDDKRYYCCKLHSIPYGDFRIKKFELDGVCPICAHINK
jgi:hypothetical protein